MKSTYYLAIKTKLAAKHIPFFAHLIATHFDARFFTKANLVSRTNVQKLL